MVRELQLYPQLKYWPAIKVFNFIYIFSTYKNRFQFLFTTLQQMRYKGNNWIGVFFFCHEIVVTLASSQSGLKNNRSRLTLISKIIICFSTFAIDVNDFFFIVSRY